MQATGYSHPKLKFRYIALTASLLSLIHAKESIAEAWVLQPAVSLRQTVDDNYRLSVNSQARELSTTELGLEAGISRVTQSFESRLRLKLEAISYSGDEEDLEDRLNNTLFFTTANKSEVSAFKLDGRYTRDSLLRNISVVDDTDITIEPDDNTDSGLRREDISRDRLYLRPSWRRGLSQISNISINYRFNQVEHERQIDGLVDYRDHYLTMGYSRRYSPIDTFHLTLGGQVYEPDLDNVTEYTTLSLTGGINRKLTPTSDVGLRLGVRTTEFERTVDNSTSKESDTGYLLSLDGQQNTGLNRYTARIERNVFPSASGQQVEADQLLFNANRKHTELLSLFVRSRLFQNRTIGNSNNNNDRRYVQIQPGLSWNFSRWWNVDLAYRYRREKKDGIFESGESHALLFTLQWSKARNL